MKLLYITDALAIWGGIERILVEKANFLAERYGCDVHFITVNQGEHKMVFPLCDKIKYVDLNIRFHQQYKYSGIRRLFIWWKLKRLFAKRLRNYIDNTNPDVIITARASLISEIVAVKGTVPVVYESHSLYIAQRYFSYGRFPKLKTELLCRDVRHADMIVSLTEGDAMDWKKYSSTVCVIPNIVHLYKGISCSACTEKNVIFVGRFSPQKDIDSLLKIWKIVYNTHPQWHLWIVGGFGECQDRLMKEINDIQANIDVYSPTSNIFEMYCKSSILLLTSVYESFGLVLPEAMSCGLPVIAFDCPYGPRDIIHDGVDGFLVGNRDVNLFAEKVRLLMDNYELRVRMGKEGIRSSSRYKEEIIMPRWLQLFEELRSNL